MDLTRKLGTAIVFIVPTFVFSGLVYSWFDSLSKVVAWLAVLAIFVVIGIIYSKIITGKFSKNAQEM
ncbi:MAG: hypothetical protein K8R45_07425 [Desulfobacterales bacterium]|nr:hypothetical protein [Desulfobacterales bacterium]